MKNSLLRWIRPLYSLFAPIKIGQIWCNGKTALVVCGKRTEMINVKILGDGKEQTWVCPSYLFHNRYYLAIG